MKNTGMIINKKIRLSRKKGKDFQRRILTEKQEEKGMETLVFFCYNL